MSTALPDPVAPAQIERRGIRLGDVFFRGVALVAALGTTAVLVLLAYKVFDLAWPAIQHFGLSFIWTQGWNPNSEVFGALSFIYGTVVTASIALLLATPLSVAIALFLTEISPRRLAAPIATMVELLAAIPSVVLGLWGILVFGPWVAEHLEPFLERWLGFLPFFSGDPSQAGMLPAALVLTIMIVPSRPRSAVSCSAACHATSRTDRSPSARPNGRRSGAWLSPTGARDLGRRAPRARARVRRGDRRDAGDRERQ